MTRQWTDIDYPTVFLFNLKEGTFHIDFMKKLDAPTNIAKENATGI